jgi:HK97 family phage prohead protease
MHAGSGAANENGDIDFLGSMVEHLDSTLNGARAHMSDGTHPDVVSFAHQIMMDHTSHLTQALNLQRQLGLGATPAGEQVYGSHLGNMPPGSGAGRSMPSKFYEERAAMTAAVIDNLPDSDFAYVKGSTRHFPIQDAVHVRFALAKAPRSEFGKQAMPKILAAAKKFGIETSRSTSRDAEAFRSVPFELRDVGSDGQTFEGYAAVFNSPTQIGGWEGDFEEIIAPGAFQRSLERKTPVLMFEHGKHPLIGTMPLGVITRAAEDDHGLHILAKLTDNWLIQPVRDAVRDRALTGMSFRFSVPDGGDTWQTRKGELDLRTVTEAKVAELGPVVFPAYEPTTAQVRSAMERPEPTGRTGARSPSGGDPDVKPRDGATSSTNVIPPDVRQRLIDMGKSLLPQKD